MAFACATFAALVIQAFIATSLHAQATERPNVIVVLTDDQGWGDLSVNGNVNLSTPNIDSLAREGATLQNFFVCQVCAPTRAEFLTGRYYPKTGVSGVSRGEGRLNPDETTIADLLKRAGYATGAFGKWHNGTQPPYHPNFRGFEEYYGFTSGHWGHYFSPPLDHNGKKVRGNGFIVDDFTDHAIDFIKQHSDKPFFCYLPLNTPHSPMMVPDRFYEKFANADLEMRHDGLPKEKEDLSMTRAALAMVENIDWNVGRVLQTLDQLKIVENTIVIYFSDNGPNSYRWNGGMKGRKGSLDEGGLRSPFFIRWPAQISAGKSISQIAGAIDLLPTLCDLAEVKCKTSKEIDGLSLKPLLLEQSTEWPDRSLLSTKNQQVSVRTQRYRLDAAGRLYDMQNDVGQRTDVSLQHPKLSSRLRAAQSAHAAAMRSEFDKYEGRPFTVGFAKSTTLPARDGVEHGTIKRSAKPPNNSFFTHWTSADDSITWQVDVLEAAEYEATVFYTCAEGNQGVTVQLEAEYPGTTRTTETIITEVFDPPLYDKSKERVEQSHYFVKDFRPQKLGTVRLQAGRAVLRLKAANLQGTQAIDVHSIELNR